MSNQFSHQQQHTPFEPHNHISSNPISIDTTANSITRNGDPSRDHVVSNDSQQQHTMSAGESEHTEPPDTSLLSCSPYTTNGSISAKESGTLLTEEQLTLLKLRFDESEFGVSVAELAGPDSKGLPLSCNGAGDTSSLNTTDNRKSHPICPFSAISFVNEKQEYMSAQDLESDLIIYSKYLQRMIMQRIHDDIHEAFITVSSQLMVVQPSLTAVVQPLARTLTKAEEALRTLESVRTEAVKAISKATLQESLSLFYTSELQIMLLYDQICVFFKDYYNSVSTNECREGYNYNFSDCGIRTLEKLDKASLLCCQLWLVFANMPTPKGLIKVMGDECDIMGSCDTKNTAINSDCPLESEGNTSSLDQDTNGQSMNGGTIGTPVTSQTIETIYETLHQLVTDTERVCKDALTRAVVAANGAYMNSNNNTIDSNINNDLDSIGPTSVLSTPYYRDGSYCSSHEEPISIIRSYFSLFRRIGKEDWGIAIYKESVLRPVLEGVVSYTAVSEARSKSAAAGLFRKLHHTIDTRLLPLLPLLRSLFNHRHNDDEVHSDQPILFSPLAQIMLPAISDTIARRMVPIFTPALTSSFHSTFTAFQDIVRLLESQCVSVEELRELREGISTLSQVWSVPLGVYESLVGQDVKTAIDGLLCITSRDSPPSEENTENDNNKSLQFVADISTSTTARAYHFHYFFTKLEETQESVFSDKVFLYPIGSGLLKQSVAAITRACHGLAEKVIAGQATLSPTPPSSMSSKMTSTTTGLCFLLHDLSVYLVYVRGVYVEKVCAALREPHYTDISVHTSTQVFSNVLKFAAATVETTIRLVRDAIGDGLLSEVGECLSCVVQFVPQARGVETLPDSPNITQVSKLTGAIDGFIASLGTIGGTKAAKADARGSSDVDVMQERECFLIELIGVKVVGCFRDKIDDALAKASQRQEAMMRLRGGRHPETKDGKEYSSGVDKLAIQLWLDVSLFKSHLSIRQYILGAKASDTTTFDCYFDEVFEPLRLRAVTITSGYSNGLNSDTSIV